MDRPTVVLVGELPGIRLPTLRDVLERSGYDVTTCPGTGERACPALLGGTCPVGAGPVAAIVVDRVEAPRELPQVCGRALGAPVLVLEEGSARAAEFEERTARIGDTRGPVAAVQALQVLLARPA